MFTKNRGDEPQETFSPGTTATTQSPGEPKPTRNKTGRPATLGPSISISGNLSGNEDLVIEGTVEGEVMVKDHVVTISQSGKVKADVYGRSICVEGEVHGNLVGDEQVVIRQSGRVRGNVTAPRVNLENGAKFKGSIDMQPVASAPAKSEVAKKPSRGADEKSRPMAGATGPGTRVAAETA